MRLVSSALILGLMEMTGVSAVPKRATNDGVSCGEMGGLYRVVSSVTSLCPWLVCRGLARWVVHPSARVGPHGLGTGCGA